MGQRRQVRVRLAARQVGSHSAAELQQSVVLDPPAQTLYLAIIADALMCPVLEDGLSWGAKWIVPEFHVSPDFRVGQDSLNKRPGGVLLSVETSINL